MNNTEQAYAKNLLENRRVGPSYAQIVRVNIGRYSILVAALAVIIAGACVARTAGTTNAAFFFSGFVLGVFRRDWGWVKASQKMWSFYEKVIDWGLVQKIAADESGRSGNPPGPTSDVPTVSS